MRHQFIQANGIQLHVVELGRGPAILFCHGFPDTWRRWRRQMEAVAAAGYRAVALDMRGYGQSSIPESPDQYTVLQSVGDLIGILDALDIKSAVVIGHDFGASVAWNAALMRPDRFHGVCGISVAFAPRGEQSLLQTMAAAGHEDFYMFDRRKPEADQKWANGRLMYAANLYWSSAAPPEAERWTLFNRELPKYFTLPEPLPAWANMADVNEAAAEFERNGFHGPLNYYRAMQLGFDLTAAFKGKLIDQPSFFIVGEKDGLKDLGPAPTVQSLRKVLPGLIDSIVIPGVAHWPQLEAADATNQALLHFLERIPNSP